MDREREIREIAYRIWEQEGRPAGREKIHWSRAEEHWKSSRKSPAGPAKVRRTAPPVRTRQAVRAKTRLRSFGSD